MATAPKLDQDLREFLENQAGMIVMLSDDPLFVRALRATVFKTLGVKTDCLQIHTDPVQALKGISDRLSRKLPVLVLADRLLRGRNTLDFLRTVKTTFAEARTMVITQETSKEGLSQLYEIGVDSIVTKPVSIDTLVEKMAGAIKPQSKISQMVQEARGALDQGDTAKVKQIAQEILRLKEKSPVAFMLLGDAFLAEDRRDEAIRAYEAAHLGARLYLEPLKKLAEAHKELDDDAYLRYLRKLDVISPLNTDRKCEIGKVYVRRNDMEHADRYFSEAIATAQREALHHVDRVVQEIAEVVAESSPDLAEKYYVQLLDMKGDNLTLEDMITFNRLGIALRRQGKWREAVENYKKALTVAPNDERVLYNMGLAYADGQLHRMAVGAFEQVQRIAPEFHKTAAVVAYNMANAFAMTKDIPSARYYLAAALERDPGHAASRRLLTRLEQLGV
ncbi:MAG: tetratricopeptide repeat protein [Humidesulfovibrio sp.]|uniref:response regulator n=1 Tax=Humidesulfovibrio sp. TaxID=2910988 RepID=UPI002732FB18|nr:response regulator [Humidesulfovibrio sp.]MDP2847568.1 tetratricopeptide repeat protein [Humidesulfovibrio sp.]